MRLTHVRRPFVIAVAIALEGLVLAAASARAEIRLPAILGDHMVLQRGGAAVWGTAMPGSTITARIAGVHATGVADASGTWRVAFGAELAPGGPFDLTLDGDGTVVVHDVLIGDVWLGAGQSNMALPVRVARDGGPPASADECGGLRLFTVERAVARAPLRDVRGAWRVCTPQSAADFSAVAYFFGRDLTAALGVPVGLVVTAWGSTTIDVWRPDAAPTAASPAAGAPAVGGVPFALDVADLRLIPNDPTREPVPIALDTGSDGLGGAWRAYAKAGSTARWEEATDAPRGGRFSGELADPDAWASATTPLRTAKLPVDLTGFARAAFRARGEGEFRLTLGQASITDGDVYASDVIVPGTRWTPYEVALDALKQGGWGVKQPFARDAVTTAGFAISAPPPRARASAFDAMVAPLAPLRLRGVLWYQGEADVLQADAYAAKLADLIGGWREAFRAPLLPFLVVQLPAYGPVAAEPGESRWADLRAAQGTAASLPATAIVTTIDLGDANDIHPKRKAEVGRRLARAALRLDDTRRAGAAATRPVAAPPAATAGADGTVTVRFADSSTATPLATRDGAPLVGFALSGDGHTFRWAGARILDARTVAVQSDDVAAPVAVRYAWADSPVCNLTTADGAPVAPFALAVTRASAPDAATGRSPGASAAPRGSDPPPVPAAH